MPLRLTLVTGGARSGKSQFAEALARGRGPNVVYLATGSAGDLEMRRRIAAHRRRRPATWRTIEAACGLASAVDSAAGPMDAIVLDDIGFLLTNLLGDEPVSMGQVERQLRQEERALWSTVSRPGVPLIAVTNEVGSGLVPVTPLGRVFRDLLGRCNQRWAARSESVYLLVAGQALRIK